MTDVVVIGLGAMGGQAALHLARAGAHVVGVDRWAPPHPHGSSHGQTRVIREAYFEGPGYVPLVRRAFDLWDADLPGVLTPCPGLYAGPPDGEVLPGVRAAAATWDIAVRDEVPGAFRHPALAEPRAGVLDVDAAVAGTLELARAAGADLRFGARATAIDGTSVTLDDGTTLRADRVVVCAGAWTGALVPAFPVTLTVLRQVLLWFDAPPGAPDAVFFFEGAPGEFLYGFPPDAQGRLKVARHGGGRPTNPDAVDRALHETRDVAPVRALVDELFVTPAGPLRDHAVCLYTMTPDGHFAFGALPDDPRVVVCSACSGHGFKFAPAVGEALAAQALGREPPVDVSAFALS